MRRRASNSDVQNENYYLNKLLTIVEGEGRGQYGYITSYDWNTGGVISGTVTSGTDATRVTGTYTGKLGTSSNALATEPTVTINIDGTGDATITVTDSGSGAGAQLTANVGFSVDSIAVSGMIGFPSFLSSNLPRPASCSLAT